MSNQETNYDALFRDSQVNKFPKPGREKSPYDEMYRSSQQRTEQTVPVTPEVMNADGRPLRQSGGISADSLGLVSVIIGVAAFILVFVGMFLHFFMWLNILVCLTGIGFGIAALLKQAASRVMGIIGIILCIFDLLVELICMIVVVITSGISAIFHLLT